MSNEQPVGFVERLPDGQFNRFLCPVKTRTETVPVYLSDNGQTRTIAGYYDAKDKGLPPSSTWAWILERTPSAERRIAVYVDV